MTYSKTAVDLLKALGWTEPTGRTWIEEFQKDNQAALPQEYQDFMSIAYNCELLGTSSLWIGKKVGQNLTPYFFYETIEEMIQDYREDWEEDPISAQEDAFYSFYQLPQEQWPQKSEDYLQIGSDYGAGIITFGIKKQDLTQADPPVYFCHEEAPTTWNRLCDTVSQFLYEEVVLALLCSEYETAQRVLKRNGWQYLDCLEGNESVQQALEKKGIDVGQLHPAAYNHEERWICVQNSDTQQIYVGRVSKHSNILYEISHT